MSKRIDDFLPGIASLQIKDYIVLCLVLEALGNKIETPDDVKNAYKREYSQNDNDLRVIDEVVSAADSKDVKALGKIVSEHGMLPLYIVLISRASDSMKFMLPLIGRESASSSDIAKWIYTHYSDEEVAEHYIRKAADVALGIL